MADQEEIRDCEIQSFHMIILLQSSVQMSFNTSLKTDVSHCCSFPSFWGIWLPHLFFRKPHHWMGQIERCTMKGERCCVSIFFSLYFCTFENMREKDAQGSQAHWHFASNLRFEASTLCIRYTRHCVPMLLQDQRPSLVGASITQLQGRFRIF